VTPTNKGNYSFCIGCRYHIPEQFDVSSAKYPCMWSHAAVRGLVKYERDFTKCLLKQPPEPVYEYQWYRLVKCSQNKASIGDYYKGAEMRATELLLGWYTEKELECNNNGKEHYLYVKIEETKRINDEYTNMGRHYMCT